MTLATLDDVSLEEVDTQNRLEHVVGLLEAVETHNSLLVEELSDLEVAAEGRGWRVMEMEQDRELSRAGLVNVTRNCALMTVASPLIRRGMQLRIGYVWGQGVQVQARAGDDEGEQDVNAVVQEFWDDPSNQLAFTSSQAQEENERALGTDGNLVFTFFPHPLTGRVQIRVTPFEEIQDKIANPEDRDETWFFFRQYSVVVREPGYAGTVRRRRETRRVLHPALGYWPVSRPKEIDGLPVLWDQPMLHVTVNKPTRHAKWGIPDVYAALPWARAYEGFLTDWARLVKALSKFAWRLTGDRASKTRRSVATLQAGVPPRGTTIPGQSDAGGLAAMGPGQHLEAIPKSGATVDSDSGRPLAAMVAAALGVPVTMLLADPGTTGARAVAETLDKPTILEMGMRRQLWTSVIATVLDYVIVQSVKAPRGPLRGTVIRDQTTGRETITLTGDVERTVDIDWPDLNELDPVQLVQAIVAADSTDTLPKEQIARLLLQALRVKDVDEVIAEMVDPETGVFRTPEQDAGDAAAQKFRRGQDPAEDLS